MKGISDERERQRITDAVKKLRDVPSAALAHSGNDDVITTNDDVIMISSNAFLYGLWSFLYDDDADG